MSASKSFCDLCEREFKNDSALQSHLANSKEHKWERPQRSEQAQSPQQAAAALDTAWSGQQYFAGVAITSNVVRGPANLSMFLGSSDQQQIASGPPLFYGWGSFQHENNPKSYCDVCEREFKNDSALQSHISNSKEHKKWERRQRSEQARNAQQAAAALSGASSSQQYLDGVAIAPDVVPGPANLTQLSALGNYTSLRESSTGTLLGFSAQQQVASGAPLFDGWSSFQHGNNYWSVAPVEEWQDTLDLLAAHCHTAEDLEKNQYVLRPYGPEDLEGLYRCKNCNVLKRNLKRGSTECLFHPGRRLAANKTADRSRPFSCCGQGNRGCKTFPAHEFTKLDRMLASKYQEYAPTPAAIPGVPKRRAVALDCEMAGLAGGIGTVILLSAVDYLTGETLVNALVRPSARVVDWRTRVSGVSPQDMEAAIARGEALDRWKGARAELWKHIDADTILIGHALQHDLDALRIAHTRIVDSGILARNAVGPCGRQWGLKSLCEELLRINVQTNTRNGHDCTEDALAAREVVLWCCRNQKELQAWGVATREVELRKMEERKKEDQKKDEERKEARKRAAAAAEGKENGRPQGGTAEN